MFKKAGFGLRSKLVPLKEKEVSHLELVDIYLQVLTSMS